MKDKKVWVTYHRPGSPAAYCLYHKWNLSVRQIRAKGCLHKKSTGSPCQHLKIYLTHPWWAERMTKKARKVALLK